MVSGAAQAVLVLGCGRSGTSIFGELFDGVGPYTYHSEPPFERVVSGALGGLVAIKVPHESAGHPPDSGLSFPLDTLLERIPGVRIFWIIRNPLDAVCSLRVGIANDWGHHPRPPDWRAWRSRPLIEQCAHHWQDINADGYAHVSSIASLVHFESMIEDPYRFAVRVCEQTGLEVEREEPAVRAWADRVQDTNNERFVEAETSRGYSRRDHSVRVGRWRENLTADEVDVIWAIVGETARTFGYERPHH